MAGSVNKVILLGNLGKDPEVKYFEDGKGFAKFTMATSESYKDKNGERKEITEWHNVAVWRPGLVDIVEKYLKKGNKVYVEGKLKTRSWEDEDKTTKYITEIVVDNLTLLSGPTAKDESTSTTPNVPTDTKPNKTSNTEQVNESDSKDDTDDLPF